MGRGDRPRGRPGDGLEADRCPRARPRPGHGAPAAGAPAPAPWAGGGRRDALSGGPLAVLRRGGPGRPAADERHPRSGPPTRTTRHPALVAGAVYDKPPWWSDAWFMWKGVGALASTALVVLAFAEAALSPRRLRGPLGVAVAVPFAALAALYSCLPAALLPRLDGAAHAPGGPRLRRAAARRLLAGVGAALAVPLAVAGAGRPTWRRCRPGLPPRRRHVAARGSRGRRWRSSGTRPCSRRICRARGWTLDASSASRRDRDRHAPAAYERRPPRPAPVGGGPRRRVRGAARGPPARLHPPSVALQPDQR